MSIHRRAQGWVLLTLVLLIISAYYYRPASTEITTGDAFMLAALVTFGVAVWRGAPLQDTVPAPHSVATSPPVRWLPVSAGAALLWMLSEYNGKALNIPLPALSVHMQFLLLILGTTLFVIGAGGIRLSIQALRDLRQTTAEWRTSSSFHTAMLLTAITVLAFCIRVWNVQDAIRAFMDEGPFIMDVVAIRNNPTTTLLTPMHGTSSFTRIFSYLQMVFSDVFGSSLGMIRVVGAVFGTLTVPALYLLTRWTFSEKTALLAALLLATFPPHVHMSRIGINNIADPLFGVLALAFLVRAIQTRSRLHYVIAGAMTGLLPYFYEGGKLLFPALIILWLIWLAIAGWKRPSARGLNWMVVSAFMVTLPAYYTLAGIGAPFFSRLSARNLGGDLWSDLLLTGGLSELRTFFTVQIMPPLLHYFHAPDGSTFYSGDTALVLPYLVPLFFLGIFHAFWRLRGAGVLLLLWLLLTVLGNSLIYDSAWTARFVVVLPCIALLLAVGLKYTLSMLQPARSDRWLLIFTGVIVVGQVIYYFGPHLRYYQPPIAWLNCHYDGIFRVLDRPEDEWVYLAPRDYLQDDFTQYFLDYLGIQTRYISVIPPEWEHLELPPDQNASFFLTSDDKQIMGLLQRYWHLEGPYFSPYDPVCDEQFAMYLAPLSARRRVDIP